MTKVHLVSGAGFADVQFWITEAIVQV